MDDISLNLLNDKFNMYYENAKRAQNEGNAELAKRNYMLAAETLLKLAKISSPELKKARLERAKRLIEIAENVGASIENKRFEKDFGNMQAGAQKEEDGGRAWAAAQIPDVHFSDIAGLEDVKKAITTRMINPLKYPDKYAAYGKKTGGGVLLYGPPGTGKTMIAKAIACEVGATFYAIKGSDIVSKWVGESEKNINSLFETARKDKLAIIFIDEMDSLIGQRGVDTHNDKRVNEFLQQIDGFVGRNPNLLLLGATNRPWDIDGAAMRSGRFSQKIYVPLPDAPARKFLFEKGVKNAPLSSDVDIDELVALSDGYSGADIDEVCDRAKEDPVLRAIKGGDIVPVERADFIKALRSVRPSVNPAEIKAFEKYAGISSPAVGGLSFAVKSDFGAENAPAAPEMPKAPEKTFAPDKNGAEGVSQNAAKGGFAGESGNAEVELAAEKINLLPDEKPRLEFFVDKKCDAASVKIGGTYYACEKHIRNFLTQPLDVEAGKYNAEIFADGKKIAEKTVEFVKGIEENDFDI